MTPDNDDRLEQAGKYLGQLISDDAELQRVCDELAKAAVPETATWSAEDWEQNEFTTAYQLYYSEFVRYQTIIVSHALQYLIGR